MEEGEGGKKKDGRGKERMRETTEGRCGKERNVVVLKLDGSCDTMPLSRLYLNSLR